MITWEGARAPAARATTLASVRGRLYVFSASAAYAALLVLLRGRPSLKSDAGVFLSVAGSMLHGDRLYAGVLDNKDPLFYYAHAGALAAFGWTGPFLLDILWLAIAAASTLLLLRAAGASWLTAAVGFVAYPLLLTGAWYLSGYSLLAALSFVPLVGLLWLRGRFVAAGALLALGVLFKVNLGLVLVSVPLAALMLGPRELRSQLTRAVGGFAAVIAAGALVLALRGELHGYIENFKENISYSSNVLSATGNVTGVPGHFKVAAWAASRPGHFAFLPVGKPLHLLVVAAVFLLAGYSAIRVLRRPKPAREAGESTTRFLAAAFLAASATTAITLALTAAWSPHDQMLAFPALMLIVFVVARLAPALAEKPRLIAAGAVCASRRARHRPARRHGRGAICAGRWGCLLVPVGPQRDGRGARTGGGEPLSRGRHDHVRASRAERRRSGRGVPRLALRARLPGDRPVRVHAAPRRRAALRRGQAARSHARHAEIPPGTPRAAGMGPVRRERRASAGAGLRTRLDPPHAQRAGICLGARPGRHGASHLAGRRARGAEREAPPSSVPGCS